MIQSLWLSCLKLPSCNYLYRVCSNSFLVITNRNCCSQPLYQLSRVTFYFCTLVSNLLLANYCIEFVRISGMSIPIQFAACQVCRKGRILRIFVEALWLRRHGGVVGCWPVCTSSQQLALLPQAREPDSADWHGWIVTHSWATNSMFSKTLDWSSRNDKMPEDQIEKPINSIGNKIDKEPSDCLD